MSKAKIMSSLSGMVDSVGEESDADMMSMLDSSNQENQAPMEKARGVGKAPRARKTKPASKKLSVRKAKPVAKSTGRKAPLKEQGLEPPTDTEEAENSEEVVEDKTDKQRETPSSVDTEEAVVAQPQPKRKGRPPGKAKKAKVDAVQDQENITEKMVEKATEKATEKMIEKDGEFEYTPRTSRKDKEIGSERDTLPEVKEASPSGVTSVMQPIPMDLDVSQFEERELAAEPRSIYRQASHARSNSRQARPILASTRRRGNSISDTEHATEPDLRRKLGEMTGKFESLDLKYRNLREIGIKEAEANFEKLKKQSEDQTRVANDLIASLRKELSIQKAQSNEARAQQELLTSTQSTLTTAESQVTELKASLASAQNENKALQAKLAASRFAATNAETNPAYGKTPGSAAKGRAQASRLANGVNADAGSAAQVAQLKEDLYSDLTGLILRGVDRQEETDTYDCIQTGRNGTLHFKLVVPTDTTASYDEMEIQYMPRLDANRDKALLEILPDYLREEITFSNANATKFYSRVVDTLTKRFED